MARPDFVLMTLRVIFIILLGIIVVDMVRGVMAIVRMVGS